MADNDNNRNVALAGVGGAAVGAAITYAIAQAQKASTPGGNGKTVILDPATEALLTAIAQANGQIVTDIESILAALSGVTIIGYPLNCDTIATGRILLSATAPVNFPYLAIPDAFGLVVKAFPGNPPGSYVLVANSKSGASGLDTSYPLLPNEAIIYKVKNAQCIWAMATIVPAWLSFTVEQRSS